MCATGYCSALHGIPSGNLFWKPWTMKGRRMETEQPLSYHMHVLTIAYYLSLPPCGQLGSSNHTALFILSYTKDLSLISYTFIIDLSVCTYDSALSFLVICVQCYIGPCGVLVPTGMVHSNNEFNEFNEFIGARNTRPRRLSGQSEAGRPTRSAS